MTHASNKPRRPLLVPLLLAGFVLFPAACIYYFQPQSRGGLEPKLGAQMQKIQDATAKDGRERSFLGTDSVQVVIRVPLAKDHRLEPALLEEVETSGDTLKSYELEVFSDENQNGTFDAGEPSVHWEVTDPERLVTPFTLESKPLDPGFEGEAVLLYELRIHTSKGGNSYSFRGRVQTQDDVEARRRGNIGA